MLHYAYVHAKPNTTTAHGIFYVGKGVKQRSIDFNHRNKYHRNIVNKYGKQNILVGKVECTTEQLAFELEIGLIKCLHRMGVTLANLSNGGEGATGMKHSQETKDKLSAMKIGKKMSDETKAKLSKHFKGRKTGPTGKSMSAASKLKISIAKKGTKHTPEARKKIAEAGKGRIFSEETKRKIAEKLKGNKNGCRVRDTRKS